MRRIFSLSFDLFSIMPYVLSFFVGMMVGGFVSAYFVDARKVIEEIEKQKQKEKKSEEDPK